MDDPQEYCDKCGTRAGQRGYGGSPPQQMISIREKSTGIAVLLSFFWAGLGQLYVGKIGRGLAMMVGFFLIVFFGVFSTITGLLSLNIDGAVGSVVLFGVLHVVLWVWNIFDAYNQANEYNDALRTSGRRPW
ncbi:MAG: hypothetical protein LBB30_03885 [Candidatus Methanoplasma sp.]|jgi:TM2 domain-containing membrane protein YozV|nr:hypothetical protein [Candidatus Methanoplasma sp.]